MMRFLHKEIVEEPAIETPQVKKDANTKDPQSAEPLEVDEQQAKQEQLEADKDEIKWFEFMHQIETAKNVWKGSKRARPNFGTMGLHRQALQNANMVDHNLPCYKADPNHDTYAGFGNAVRNQEFVQIPEQETSDDDKNGAEETVNEAENDAPHDENAGEEEPEEGDKGFKAKLEALFNDTVRKCPGVIATLYKAADPKLCKSKPTKMIIIDEA